MFLVKSFLYLLCAAHLLHALSVAVGVRRTNCLEEERLIGYRGRLDQGGVVWPAQAVRCVMREMWSGGKGDAQGMELW